MTNESNCRHGNNALWCVKCRTERENEKTAEQHERSRHENEEDMRDEV